MVTTDYPCEFKEINLDASAQFDIVRSFWTEEDSAENKTRILLV